MQERIVVALGGNAILQRGQEGTFEQQLASVRRTVNSLVDLVEEGYELVITHGNGPQVGNLLNQNEWASHVTPSMPLDVLGAQTQGMIGYMLQQSFSNELIKRGISRPVVTLLTRLEVGRDDPAFQNPTKFVGPFISEERAQQLMAENKGIFKPDVDRGWRRVVPSPQPLRIVEANTIQHLVDNGTIVIVSGGGGIPVVVNPEKDNRHIGIEAVIDKDLAANLLAQTIHATRLVILTDVTHVKLSYRTPEEKPVHEIDCLTLQQYLEAGHFPAGSMGPKVQAATTFVKETGGTALITSLHRVREAIAGYVGTRIVPATETAASGGNTDVSTHTSSNHPLS